MKPAARRRVERSIREIMASDGDRCSICKKTFDHNCKTFGGVTAGGISALVSECCKDKIKEIVLAGLYSNQNYDFLTQSTDNNKQRATSTDDIANAIDHIQKHVAGLDALGNNIARKGSVLGNTTRVHTANSLWKTDDAEWFRANPTRAHRMRRMHPGEDSTLFPGPSIPQPPSGHEHQVLVRQVEPGRRIRISFCRNTEVPIPDIEPLLHALFDTVSASKGGVINAKEIADLAIQYAGGTR